MNEMNYEQLQAAVQAARYGQSIEVGNRIAAGAAWLAARVVSAARRVAAAVAQKPGAPALL